MITNLGFHRREKRKRTVTVCSFTLEGDVPQIAVAAVKGLVLVRKRNKVR